MREAIGNTFIVNLLLVFIGVISALLIGSISYSKAYKVKNRIVYTIEKYGAWNVMSNDGSYNVVQSEIEVGLKDVGYHLKLAKHNCPVRNGVSPIYGGASDFEAGVATYDYCVYEYTFSSCEPGVGNLSQCSDLNYGNAKGHYYGVTTFMHFNIPLIGAYLQFPVYGETKPIYDVGVYYNN